MTDPIEVTYDETYDGDQLRITLPNKGAIQITHPGQFAYVASDKKKELKGIGVINNIMKEGNAYGFQIKRYSDGKNEIIMADTGHGGGVLYIHFSPEELGWLQKVLPLGLKYKLMRLMREVGESKGESNGESKFQLRM